MSYQLFQKLKGEAQNKHWILQNVEKNVFEVKSTIHEYVNRYAYLKEISESMTRELNKKLVVYIVEVFRPSGDLVSKTYHLKTENNLELSLTKYSESVEFYCDSNDCQTFEPIQTIADCFLSHLQGINEIRLFLITNSIEMEVI